MFLAWCLIALTMAVVVAVNPNCLFRLLKFVPFQSRRHNEIKNRWVLLFYRVTATCICLLGICHGNQIGDEALTGLAAPFITPVIL
jgi:uncharacterized membrane protein